MIKIFKCLRCHHEWPSKQAKPRVCPKCKSAYWDKRKKVYIHSDGTISSLTEEELLAIPEYECTKCGKLFRTTTDRRKCDICCRKEVSDSIEGKEH